MLAVLKANRLLEANWKSLQRQEIILQLLVVAQAKMVTSHKKTIVFLKPLLIQAQLKKRKPPTKPRWHNESAFKIFSEKAVLQYNS
jgi:hypothetical protein